jgi:hypothetical protein
MFGNLKLAAVGAVSLGLVMGAAGIARSDSSPHTNYVTFSRGVALPGVELAAGTYIFETPTNSMANSIVRVSSRDRRTVFLTAYTRQVERPNDKSKMLVTLGEAAPGSAPPVSAWFPIGESVGHEFIYGK